MVIQTHFNFYQKKEKTAVISDTCVTMYMYIYIYMLYHVQDDDEAYV